MAAGGTVLAAGVVLTAAPFATAALTGEDGPRARTIPVTGALGARLDDTPAEPTTTTVSVRFRPGVSPASSAASSTFTSSLRRTKAVRERSLSRLRTNQYRVPKHAVTEFVAAMKARSDVEVVSEALPVRPLLEPNDPGYATHQKAYLTAVNAPKAWDWGKGSPSVKIAVIDTGFDTKHNDLVGKFAATYNVTDGTTNVTDTDGHGTFVAGVTAAATNNKAGVAGIGFNSRLLGVKVMDDAGFMTTADVAAGIDWAVGQKAKVINISLGQTSRADPVEQAAVKAATDAGVLVVAAAGNEAQSGNKKSYPAAYDETFAVGATDAKGHRAWFSEYGSWVDLAAPGMNIRSTAPLAASTQWGSATRYATGDGTSFSAPLVAGAAALLASHAPGATVADLQAALTAGARPMTGYGLGAGQLDVQAALTALRPSTRPTWSTAAGTVGGSVALTAVAGTSRGSLAFFLDGTQIARVATTQATGGWRATTTWSTLGVANGAHTLQVRDCSATGVCARTGTDLAVTVANTLGAVTAPATASGLVPVPVAGSTGGVALRSGSTRLAFDGTAPFAPLLNTSALPDGANTVTVVQCDQTGTRCAGPSRDVTVTTTSTVPTVTGVTNADFSPNGDTVRPTATVAYQLPADAEVGYEVRNATDQVVFTAAAGRKLAGSYSYVWNGTSTAGTVVPNGSYTFYLRTSDGAATPVRGAASAALTVDTVTPPITSLTRGWDTVYPAVDGYRDALDAHVTVTEPVEVFMRVKDAAGATVKTVSVSRPAGRATVTWDGTTTAGAIAPAGKYTFTVRLTDRGGNTVISPALKVSVTKGKLTDRTATVSVKGGSAYDFGGTSTSNCATATKVGTAFTGGLWLKNNCRAASGSVPEELALAYYKVTVPAAVSYQSLEVKATGRAHSAPASFFAGLRSQQTADYDLAPLRSVTSNTTATHSLSTFAWPGYVVGGKVEVLFAVPNNGTPLRDWDVQTISIVLKYTAIV